jgi:leader peptidase (prepilin peptidase) / N-methyltransferase
MTAAGADTGDSARSGAGLLALAAVTPALRWVTLRWSVPSGEPPRTACPHCSTPIRPGTKAWLLLSPAGRCGHCRTRTGAPPWVLEALTVAGLVIAVLAAPSVALGLAAVWWLLFAVPLVFVDLAVHRLPNALTFAALAGVLVFTGVDALVRGDASGLWSSLLSAAAYGLVLLVISLILGSRGLGLGDTKLTLSIAALLGWWGWSVVFAGLFVASVFAGIAAAVLLLSKRASRGSMLPWGPFFISATLVMLALLAWHPPK